MPIIKEDPLRRYDPDDFSFKSVKGEVSEAMHYDWKRDKIDDAKKRAIYDSKCYDEFKDRVAGCTLKPIHRNEFNAPPKFSFNNRSAAGYSGASPGNSDPQATSKATAIPGSGISGSGTAVSSAEKVPRNGHEFERELRRRKTAEEKVKLIELVLDKDGLVAKLFGRELDGEMLRQVLSALEEVLDRGSATKGIARRFFVALAVDCPVSITSACAFFDTEERGTLARLLARDAASDPGEDVRVCAAFGIPIASVAEATAALSLDRASNAPAVPEAAQAPPELQAPPEVIAEVAQEGVDDMD